MRNWIYSLLLVMSALAACAPATTPAPAATLPPPAVNTVAASATTAFTATVVPLSATAAPTATAEPSATPVSEATPTETLAPTLPPATNTPSGPVSFVPAGQSVWEVPPSPDNLVGTCNSAAISVPYGLIAITQEGNTLTLRDQGVGTYVLNFASVNNYFYNGPSNLVQGQTQLNLTFLSATQWQMQSITVLDSDPTCQHIHNYLAEFKWIR